MQGYRKMFRAKNFWVTYAKLFFLVVVAENPYTQ